MDGYARATQAAESVLEDSLSNVRRVTIWLVGGVGGNLYDVVYIHANIVDEDGDTVKMRFEVPEDMSAEMDTAKAIMGYAVEVIMQHFILEKYFDKFE